MGEAVYQPFTLAPNLRGVVVCKVKRFHKKY
jgi:hypothetical protein